MKALASAKTNCKQRLRRSCSVSNHRFYAPLRSPLFQDKSDIALFRNLSVSTSFRRLRIHYRLLFDAHDRTALGPAGHFNRSAQRFRTLLHDAETKVPCFFRMLWNPNAVIRHGENASAGTGGFDAHSRLRCPGMLFNIGERLAKNLNEVHLIVGRNFHPQKRVGKRHRHAGSVSEGVYGGIHCVAEARPLELQAECRQNLAQLPICRGNAFIKLNENLTGGIPVGSASMARFSLRS